MALLSLTATAKHASATVIYDNVTAGSGAISGGTAGVAIAPTAHGPLGDSFSTGSTATTLTDLKLLLEDTTPSDGGTFKVGLYSNNSNSPGTLIATLGTFNDSLLTASLTPFDITTSDALAANTRYWIEVTGTTTSNAGWSFDTTNVGTGVASEYNFYNGGVSANNSFTPYQMEVVVSPEPVSWSLMVAASGVVAVILKRRRS